MTNTIDLLESIGQDASLRHGSSAHLAQVLSQRDASEALKQAAISGDDSLLVAELGSVEAHASNVPTQVHTAWRDDDEESAEVEEQQDDDAPADADE